MGIGESVTLGGGSYKNTYGNRGIGNFKELQKEDLTGDKNVSLKENALISIAATKQNNKLVRHPTFGLWSVSLADDLEKNIHDGLRKIVLWADKHSAKTVLFPSVKYDPFFNINTHSDLEEAQRRIGIF